MESSLANLHIMETEAAAATGTTQHNKAVAYVMSPKVTAEIQRFRALLTKETGINLTIEYILRNFGIDSLSVLNNSVELATAISTISSKPEKNKEIKLKEFDIICGEIQSQLMELDNNPQTLASLVINLEELATFSMKDYTKISLDEAKADFKILTTMGEKSILITKGIQYLRGRLLYGLFQQNAQENTRHSFRKFLTENLFPSREGTQLAHYYLLVQQFPRYDRT